MQNSILMPEDVKYILRILEENNKEAYIVRWVCTR